MHGFVFNGILNNVKLLAGSVEHENFVIKPLSIQGLNGHVLWSQAGGTETLDTLVRHWT